MEAPPEIDLPLRELMSAMLIKAVDDYLYPGDHYYICTKDDKRSARVWLFSDCAEDHILSFKNICQTMNLDRESLRQAIKERYNDNTRLSMEQRAERYPSLLKRENGGYYTVSDITNSL